MLHWITIWSTSSGSITTCTSEVTEQRYVWTSSLKYGTFFPLVYHGGPSNFLPSFSPQLSIVRGKERIVLQSFVSYHSTKSYCCQIPTVERKGRTRPIMIRACRVRNNFMRNERIFSRCMTEAVEMFNRKLDECVQSIDNENVSLFGKMSCFYR